MAAQRWSSRNALAVFIAALALRLVYLWQIRGMPFFRVPIGDGRSYWEWAGRIAGGDWIGTETFYQAPLYPYFLAAIRAVFGRSVPAVYVVQALLGSVACVLVYLAAERLFSRRVGVAAGLMLALYPPAVFFDGVLQKASVALFLTSALVLLAAATIERRRWWLWLAMGADLALLGLTRENALALAPVALAWFVWRVRGPGWKSRLGGGAALAGGFLLILLPVGIRNYCVGGSFLLTTSQMGTNFYIGNGPAADGTYVAIRPGRGNPRFERQDAAEAAERALGRSLTPGEVSDFWMARSWDHIRSRPGRWLRLMLRKSLLVVNRYEVPDAEDYYFYLRWSWLAGGLGWVWNFGVLFPLAGAGVWLTRSRGRQLWVLYALFLAMGASVAAFYLFARYRFPLVPILTPFAAAGLVEGYRAIRERKRREVTGLFAVAIVLAVVANIPVYPRSHKAGGGFYNWAVVLKERGRNDEAIEKFEAAVRLQPDLAEAHCGLADMRQQQGALQAARDSYRRAVELRRDYPRAWNNLGLVLVRMGDLDGAAAALRTALDLDPAYDSPRGNLARLARVARARGRAELAAGIEAYLADSSPKESENPAMRLPAVDSPQR